MFRLFSVLGLLMALVLPVQAQEPHPQNGEVSLGCGSG